MELFPAGCVKRRHTNPEGDEGEVRPGADVGGGGEDEDADRERVTRVVKEFTQGRRGAGPASLLPVDVVEGLVGEDEDRRGNAGPRRDVFGQVRRVDHDQRVVDDVAY